MAHVVDDHIMAAVVGSAGSGMTTIVEAVLHRAGAIPRPGSVEAGTTVTDFQPEEVARKTTLSPALTFLEWKTDDDGKRHSVTLADTPGHPDFIGGVDATLSAADLAVVVVSAVAGVTAGTKAGWAAADAAGLPRIVLVTCADRSQANFHRVLGQLREQFGSHLFPIQLPIGEEADFHGIAGVLGRRALMLGPDGKQVVEVIPPELEDEIETLHDEVTEEIVTHYDALLEAYLDGNEPSHAELVSKLAERIAAGDAVPVIVASGVTETGVDTFIDWLCRVEPYVSGRDSTIVIDGTEVAVAKDPDGEPLVHVFASAADPFLGQVSMLRVLSGTIKANDRLRNASTGAEERIGPLFRLRGAERLPVDELSAGDVGGVAKLVDTPAGSLLWNRHSGHATPRPLPVHDPVYTVSLKPVSQADTEKLSTALARATAEDPTLHVKRRDGLTLLQGLGDTHVAVAVDRLKRIFNVNVTLEPAPVAYRETIAKPADVEGKLKKQSGGHGQFAVVQLRVRPLPSGDGFQFIDSVVGGSVPRQYIPAVEKGVLDALQRGGPHGYPITDIAVELYEGKSHSVDSSEMAFRTAGALGVQEAMAKAGSVILEPIDLVYVTVPMEHQGAVMQDLATRHGRVQDTQMTDDGEVVVVASVPQSHLGRYVQDLRAITAGFAKLEMKRGHYEPLQGPPPPRP